MFHIRNMKQINPKQIPTNSALALLRTAPSQNHGQRYIKKLESTVDSAESEHSLVGHVLVLYPNVFNNITIIFRDLN